MLTNNLKKYIRSLHQTKYRQKYNKFLVEGPKWLDEIITYHTDEISQLFCTSDWINQNAGRIDESIMLTPVSQKELDGISQLKNPSAGLAVMEMPEITFRPDKVPEDWCVFLDDVQDPGNVGTILRTAAWFGYKKIYLSEKSASIFNPKVVQSSMGSVFKVRTERVEWEVLKSHCELPVVCTSLKGNSVKDWKAPVKGLVVIGNESKGVQKSILEQCDHLIKIPGAESTVESLNASVALGIVLYHLSD